MRVRSRAPVRGQTLARFLLKSDIPIRSANRPMVMIKLRRTRVAIIQSAAWRGGVRRLFEDLYQYSRLDEEAQ